MNKTKTRALQTGNVLFYLAMVIVNVVAATRTLNGVSTAEAAYKYPQLFLPAPWTFGIWSVIYLLLLLFTIYQSTAIRRVGDHVLESELSDEETLPHRNTDRVALDRPGRWVNRLDILFMLSCVFNIAWLFAWHFLDYVLSVGIVFLQFLCLAIIYLRIDSMPATMKKQDRWFVGIPFSVYLAWTTVAGISNTATMLRSLGWNGIGLSQEVWAIVCAVIVVALTSIFWFRFRDTAFVLTAAWGLAGIATNQYRNPELPSSAVATAATLACACVCLFLLFIKKRVPPVPLPRSTQGRTPTTAAH